MHTFGSAKHQCIQLFRFLWLGSWGNVIAFLARLSGTSLRMKQGLGLIQLHKRQMRGPRPFACSVPMSQLVGQNLHIPIDWWPGREGPKDTNRLCPRCIDEAAHEPTGQDGRQQQMGPRDLPLEVGQDSRGDLDSDSRWAVHQKLFQLVR